MGCDDPEHPVEYKALEGLLTAGIILHHGGGSGQHFQRRFHGCALLFKCHTPVSGISALQAPNSGHTARPICSHYVLKCVRTQGAR